MDLHRRGHLRRGCRVHGDDPHGDQGFQRQVMSTTESQPDEVAAPSELFYAGAIDRVKRTVLILGLILTPICWLLYGIRPAAGFLLGAALSYLNFHLLARAVHGLADRIDRKSVV